MYITQGALNQHTQSLITRLMTLGEMTFAISTQCLTIIQQYFQTTAVVHMSISPQAIARYDFLQLDVALFGHNFSSFDTNALLKTKVVVRTTGP